MRHLQRLLAKTHILIPDYVAVGYLVRSYRYTDRDVSGAHSLRVVGTCESRK